MKGSLCGVPAVTRCSGFPASRSSCSRSVCVGGLYTAFLRPTAARRTPPRPSSRPTSQGPRALPAGLLHLPRPRPAGRRRRPEPDRRRRVAPSIFQVESGRMPLNTARSRRRARSPSTRSTQIDQLAAFIGSHGGGPTLPNAGARPTATWRSAATCSAPTAPAATTSPARAARSLRPVRPDLSDASARVIWAAMQSGPENMPRFSDNQLTPKEKKSITSYVEFITKYSSPAAPRSAATARSPRAWSCCWSASGPGRCHALDRCTRMSDEKSIRDRLRAPAEPGEANSGGDSRGSDVSRHVVPADRQRCAPGRVRAATKASTARPTSSVGHAGYAAARGAIRARGPAGRAQGRRAVHAVGRRRHRLRRDVLRGVNQMLSAR